MIQQAVEGLDHVGRKGTGELGDDVFPRPLLLLPDQPQQHRLGGEQDASPLEEITDQRRTDELLGALAAGDRLVVGELSRLGRSLGQVIQLVDELVRQKVRFTAIKEGIRFEGKQDLQTKVMVALFGLFAEVERDLISERLVAARAKGRLLGRPKGSRGSSKLDGKEGQIRMLLEKGVSKASIAKITGVSATNLRHFIRTRKLAPEAAKAGPKSRNRLSR